VNGALLLHHHLDRFHHCCDGGCVHGYAYDCVIMYHHPDFHHILVLSFFYLGNLDLNLILILDLSLDPNLIVVDCQLIFVPSIL